MSTDYASEEAITRRQKDLAVVRPTPADKVYDQSRWNREFVKRHVVETEALDAAQREKNVLFCPACPEHRKDGLSLVHKLHVVYEEDPLKNYPFLVRTTCHGCGFKEYLPPLMPEVTAAEADLIARARKVRPLVYGGSNKLGGPQPGGILRVEKEPFPPYFIQPPQEERWKPFDAVMEQKREAALIAQQIYALEKEERAQLAHQQLNAVRAMQNQALMIPSLWADELTKMRGQKLEADIFKQTQGLMNQAQTQTKIKVAPPPKPPTKMEALRDFLTKKDRSFK